VNLAHYTERLTANISSASIKKGMEILDRKFYIENFARKYLGISIPKFPFFFYRRRAYVSCKALSIMCQIHGN